MKFRSIGLLIAFLPALVTLGSSESQDDGWLKRVPQSEHAQKSPIRKNAGTMTQGRNTFRTHCVQCHGDKAQGSDQAPALITARLQHRATVGDLHWLLVNGNKGRGMPSWAKLGDVQIWEVIGYVRSLR
jgi:mono/diheme cytochrome c family protein